jgi:hypothetical protein
MDTGDSGNVGGAPHTGSPDAGVPDAGVPDAGVPADASNARTALLAELASRPVPSLRPASLVSADPLRPLPGALLAKLEIRGRAGYDPAGPNHPRGDRWQQAVFPELGLGAAAAVVLVVALILGHGLLAAIAGAGLAASALITAAAWQWIRSDPLRIQPDERRALTAAGYWQSRQPWTAALNTGPERALLSVAVETVAQIASSPAWRSGYLDDHRLVLDLADELDGIDAQLVQIAQARLADGAEADRQRALDSALDRVLALRGYAAGLAALTGRIVVADRELDAAPAIGELRGSVDRGAYAIDGVRRLTDELAVITASVDATAAELRQERT